jgi:hypothetical protein
MPLSNQLISLEQDDDGWRTRTIEALLDTGELDLKDYNAIDHWFWPPHKWEGSTRLFRTYDTRSVSSQVANPIMAPVQTEYDARTAAVKCFRNSIREPTAWISITTDWEWALRWG